MAQRAQRTQRAQGNHHPQNGAEYKRDIHILINDTPTLYFIAFRYRHFTIIHAWLHSHHTGTLSRLFIWVILWFLWHRWPNQWLWPSQRNRRTMRIWPLWPPAMWLHVYRCMPADDTPSPLLHFIELYLCISTQTYIRRHLLDPLQNNDQHPHAYAPVSGWLSWLLRLSHSRSLF